MRFWDQIRLYSPQKHAHLRNNFEKERVKWMSPQKHAHLRNNFEKERVKWMLLLNLAKYHQNPTLQMDLVDGTKDENGHDIEIRGCASTWHWPKYNGLIQSYIRAHIKAESDLGKVLADLRDFWTVERITECLDRGGGPDGTRFLEGDFVRAGASKTGGNLARKNELISVISPTKIPQKN